MFKWSKVREFSSKNQCTANNGSSHDSKWCKPPASSIRINSNAAIFENLNSFGALSNYQFFLLHYHYHMITPQYPLRFIIGMNNNDIINVLVIPTVSISEAANRTPGNMNTKQQKKVQVVQIAKKPKRKVTRPAYLKDYA